MKKPVPFEPIVIHKHGYVRLVDYMGDDLTVANAATVSFDKEAKELTPKEVRIINFLGREGHTSPFRHAMLSFEIYAPLMVARQWWKYIIGGDHTQDSWNESSRRYITEKTTFYIPNENEWRSSPENKKQGSGPNLPLDLGGKWSNMLEQVCQEAERNYEAALKDNICPEQARLFLPAYGLYIRWRWTGSLQSVCHFINQRIAKDAQKEIADYAHVIKNITTELYPNTAGALLNVDSN